MSLVSFDNRSGAFPWQVSQRQRHPAERMEGRSPRKNATFSANLVRSFGQSFLEICLPILWRKWPVFLWIGGNSSWQVSVKMEQSRPLHVAAKLRSSWISFLPVVFTWRSSWPEVGNSARTQNFHWSQNICDLLGISSPKMWINQGMGMITARFADMHIARTHMYRRCLMFLMCAFLSAYSCGIH